MNIFSIITSGVVIAMSMVEVAYADHNSSLYTRHWTGLYAGINEGFVFNKIKLRSQQLGFTNPSGTCNTNSDLVTFSPGIQLGYMYQFPNYLVSGIEANVTFNTNQNDRLGCSCPDNPNISDRFSFKNQMQSSIKGRLGRALNGNKGLVLPYLILGASFANVGLTYLNEGGDYYSKDIKQAGSLIGAGIEWAFKQNWSLRAEYSYVNYGNTLSLKIPSVYGLLDPKGTARVDLNCNNISIAINYWI